MNRTLSSGRFLVSKEIKLDDLQNVDEGFLSLFFILFSFLSFLFVFPFLSFLFCLFFLSFLAFA